MVSVRTGLPVVVSKPRKRVEIGHVEHMFHHGHAFGGMEGDVALPALDEFQIEEFAIGIEFGDESVVIGGLRLAVDARDEIALLERIIARKL